MIAKPSILPALAIALSVFCYCAKPELETDPGDQPPADENTEPPVQDEGNDDEKACGNGTLLVIGCGASGTCAAIQAARMGVETIVVEEYPWIGGMLTSAGVSAFDGCYKMRHGLFGEFCDALASHYGSYAAMKTGWVSNQLFEPAVGEDILERMVAAESKIRLIRNASFEGISKTAKGWMATFVDSDGAKFDITADIVIDGTELGDVAKAAGVPYHVGMDSKSYTGESACIGPNDIVQDITMVMTLKNYGHDVTITMPEGYDESLYYNCCKSSYNVPNDKNQALWSSSEMLSYGLLPHGEYMINWPISGNDYYVNMIDMSREEREEAVRRAKLHSLGFLYFMQTKLGYSNLGLADDQYPSADMMPFIPYHRESRRIEGEYLFTVDEAASPFDYATPGYRTGIAVGDYPVDHHHYQRDDYSSLKINFPTIIPFTVPLGVIIPKDAEDLIVAEKSISVSNLANGTTRLQPVCMELGQAAGVLAALSIQEGCPVREVSVRKVQKVLMESGAMLQPYLDMDKSDAGFAVLQRIGCTGIMRGTGKTVGWSNEMRFYPSETLIWSDLHLEDYYDISYNGSSSAVSGSQFQTLLREIVGDKKEIPDLSGKTSLSRMEAANLIDEILDPFNNFDVSLDGRVKSAK